MLFYKTSAFSLVIKIYIWYLSQLYSIPKACYHRSIANIIFALMKSDMKKRKQNENVNWIPQNWISIIYGTSQNEIWNEGWPVFDSPW